MTKKEAVEILKYKDLTTEIEHMWNVQTNVIPVITGITGTISKIFIKCLRNIPGKHEIKKNYSNSPIGHCTHTPENTALKIQNIHHVK